MYVCKKRGELIPYSEYSNSPNDYSSVLSSILAYLFSSIFDDVYFPYFGILKDTRSRTQRIFFFFTKK